jgi:hypothetical protein
MEKHSKAVGTDMGMYSHRTLESLYPNNVLYVATDIDEDLLGLIREDPGVESVTCGARRPQWKE